MSRPSGGAGRIQQVMLIPGSLITHPGLNRLSLCDELVVFGGNDVIV